MRKAHFLFLAQLKQNAHLSVSDEEDDEEDVGANRRSVEETMYRGVSALDSLPSCAGDDPARYRSLENLSIDRD